MSNKKNLANKTIFITGASRGIGKEIGLRCARDGANIVIAAKTATAHPKLPGTIYTAAKEIEDAGGQCLPCIVDVRDESQVIAAVENAVKQFGGIDILINNASAINISGTLNTTMKWYDLMNQVNARGTFLCSKICLPHLKKSLNPHILNMSPPLDMDSKWFKSHTAYTMAKYGMSMCSLGMSEEFKSDGIAVNTLWPRTAILTAAMEMLGGSDVASKCRKPAIMADAAYEILTRPSRQFTGNFCIDERLLRNSGVTDFEQYAYDADSELMVDLYINDDVEFPLEIEKLKKNSIYNYDEIKLRTLMKTMADNLNEKIVEEIGGITIIDITDDCKWMLNLKGGSGKIEELTSSSSENVDTTISLNSENMKQLLMGKKNSTQLFMEGNLKIEGDMNKAMKLEILFSKMRPSL